jgi:hypothetical protein
MYELAYHLSNNIFNYIVVKHVVGPYSSICTEQLNKKPRVRARGDPEDKDLGRMQYAWGQVQPADECAKQTQW